jgi:hypothetical protein
VNRQTLPAVALGCALLAGFGSAMAAPPHSISWTKQSAAIGTVITIAGQEFVIARIPVRDFNGDKYAITLPVPSQFGQITFGIVSVAHITDPIVGNVTIDGYPAVVTVSDSRTFTITPDYLDPPNNRLGVTSDASVSVQIKLGAGIVILGQNFEGRDPLTLTTPETDVSIGASVNAAPAAEWWKYTDPLTLITALDRWIDYVRVYKY